MITLAAVIAVVIVVLVVVGKNDDGGDQPNSDSGTSLDFKEYNPFYLESTTFSE